MTYKVKVRGIEWPRQLIFITEAKWNSIHSTITCHELTVHQAFFSELRTQQWTKQNSHPHWAYTPLRKQPINKQATGQMTIGAGLREQGVRAQVRGHASLIRWHLRKDLWEKREQDMQKSGGRVLKGQRTVTPRVWDRKSSGVFKQQERSKRWGHTGVRTKRQFSQTVKSWFLPWVRQESVRRDSEQKGDRIWQRAKGSL